MILTPQQAAAVLAVMNEGGTGTMSFHSPLHHDVVTVRTSGVIVSRFRADGQQTAPETYASFAHFRLAYTEAAPDLARAAAHYIPMAAEAKTMAQHVADGEGRN